MKAIQTRYAGCHFRSRLEARWAVFFDALHIKWEYESQGYFVGEDEKPYLPDFWLPELQTLVEVKGGQAWDWRLMLRAAQSGIADNILLLEGLPQPIHTWHASLHPEDNDVGAVCQQYFVWSDDNLEAVGAISLLRANTIRPRFDSWTPDEVRSGRAPDNAITVEWPDLKASPKVAAAYAAARSARFEHGQKGAT